jgi:hypothetical protein
MDLGCTGRDTAVPLPQAAALKYVLQWYFDRGFTKLHHGDCINLDALANNLARQIGYRTKSHPPIKNGKRAFCVVDEEAEPKEYLHRDDDIAFEGDHLVADQRCSGLGHGQPCAVHGNGTSRSPMSGQTAP